MCSYSGLSLFIRSNIQCHNVCDFKQGIVKYS